MASRWPLAHLRALLRRRCSTRRRRCGDCRRRQYGRVAHLRSQPQRAALQPARSCQCGERRRTEGRLVPGHSRTRGVGLDSAGGRRRDPLRRLAQRGPCRRRRHRRTALDLRPGGGEARGAPHAHGLHPRQPGHGLVGRQDLRCHRRWTPDRAQGFERGAGVDSQHHRPDRSRCTSPALPRRSAARC